MITAITIVSMTLAAVAGNVDITPLSANSGDLTSIEKAGPHTKQYRDLKEVIDRYERDVKSATSCEDLNDAYDSYISSLLIMVFDDEYDYDDSDLLTDEESQELSDLGDRIDQLLTEKKNQFGCVEEEEEEETPEVVPTTTEEWDEIIAEYEVLLAKLEALRKQNLNKEQNLAKFYEIVQEHMDLIDRLDVSDESTITEAQDKRLTEINERIAVLTKEMGLVE